MSKAKQAQWMREYRKRNRYNAPGNTQHVIPNVPLLDAVSPSVQCKGSSTVIPTPFKTLVTDTGEIVQFDADGNRIYDE